MKTNSAERNEAVLSKLLPPYSLTVAELAQQEGIAPATLYNWRKQAKLEGRLVSGKQATSERWSAEVKLATAIDTAALSEVEVSEYCRAKGLCIRIKCSDRKRSLYKAFSAMQSKKKRCASRLSKINERSNSSSMNFPTKRRLLPRRRPYWCCKKAHCALGYIQRRGLLTSLCNSGAKCRRRIVQRDLARFAAGISRTARQWVSAA